MTGFFHYPAGSGNRVFDGGNTGYSAGQPRLSIHDGSIQFRLPVFIQYGTLSGIEQRTVLHEPHHGLHGIQAASTMG